MFGSVHMFHSEHPTSVVPYVTLNSRVLAVGVSMTKASQIVLVDMDSSN